MAKNTSVFGIYPDRTTVSDAIGILHKGGYRPADIAVLSAENQGSKDFAHEKSSKAPEGAAAGAAVGAIGGLLLGWLAATGVVAFPGLEALGAVRPVVAALAAAACGGALGWLIGLFVGWTMPEYVAKRYAGRMGRGGILVSVHCDSSEWRQRAQKSLKDTGARYIAFASESAADYATTDKPTPREPVAITDRDKAHESRT
ncbi:MAG TPA: hypothetical protein VKX49_25305 [Bryobacteraceae bacterium]|nr:hypothetical protein [Bryobacteraceae bacterium]